MTRPDWIPEDIWDDATERAGGEFAYAEVVRCVAIAILEERERCAHVAERAAYDAIRAAVVCHGEMTTAEIDSSAADVSGAVLSGA